jgi:hypothetical protein
MKRYIANLAHIAQIGLLIYPTVEINFFISPHVFWKASNVEFITVTTEADLNIAQFITLNTVIAWTMPSSGMWRLVALSRTDVSDELVSWTVWVERMRDLGET